MTKKLFRSIHGLLIVIGVFLSLAWNNPSIGVNANAQGKPATVRLQTTPDGFTGTCDADSEMAQLEAHRLYDGSSISRIRHSDGHVLVETVLKGSTLEFNFPNVKLAMDLANQTLIGTSEKDKEELQKFLQSADAALARKCIVSLIHTLKQDKETNRFEEKNLVPLVVMFTGMLLADKHPLPQPTATP